MSKRRGPKRVYLEGAGPYWIWRPGWFDVVFVFVVGVCAVGFMIVTMAAGPQ